MDNMLAKVKQKIRSVWTILCLAAKRFLLIEGMQRAVFFGIALPMLAQVAKMTFHEVNAFSYWAYALGSFFISLLVVFVSLGMFYKLAPGRPTRFAEVWVMVFNKRKELVMKIQLGIIGLLLSCTALPSFAEQPMAPMEMKKETAQPTHQGEGKIVSIDKAKLTVKIAHEAIKSLGWSSMTMDFKVADAALLDGFKAGDAISFELGKNAKGKWQIIRISPQNAKPTMAR